MAQIVYFIFGTFGTLYSLYVGTDAITGFGLGLLVESYLDYIAICLNTLSCFIKFSSKFVPDKKELKHAIKNSIGVDYLLSASASHNNKHSSGIMPDRYLYRNSFMQICRYFGVTTIRLMRKIFCLKIL